MSSSPFGQYSLAGWVFLVTLIASLAQSDSKAWHDLSTWVNGTSSGPSSISTAVFAAVAGVGAPPALGFVLTRAASVVWGWWSDHFSKEGIASPALLNVLQEAASPKQRVTLQTIDADGKGIDPDGFRRMLFNTCADPKLLAEYQSRATELYAEFSCALAIVAAELVAFAYQGLSPIVAGIALLLAALLGFAAFKAWQSRLITRSAWVSTFGVVEARKLGQEISDPRPIPQPLEGLE